MYCVNQKTYKKTELPRTLNRCICPQRKPVIDGIKNKKKKEEQEVQSTLTLKSGGKSCIRKSSFRNVNSVTNCKLISKI